MLKMKILLDEICMPYLFGSTKRMCIRTRTEQMCICIVYMYNSVYV